LGGLERFGLATLADAEEVDDALLCEMPDGWWMCMLRTEDTDEDVDLRPPMPERRLYEERGVRGCGDSDSRFACDRPMLLLFCDPYDEAVDSLGRAGYVDRVWISGRACVWLTFRTCRKSAVALRRRSILLSAPPLLCCAPPEPSTALVLVRFSAGALLRRGMSVNQDFIRVSCARSGCW